jgi:hypothetical protein
MRRTHVGYLKEMCIEVIHVHEAHCAQYKHSNLPNVESTKQQEEEVGKTRETANQTA